MIVVRWYVYSEHNSNFNELKILSAPPWNFWGVVLLNKKGQKTRKLLTLIVYIAILDSYEIYTHYTGK